MLLFSTNKEGVEQGDSEGPAAWVTFNSDVELELGRQPLEGKGVRPLRRSRSTCPLGWPSFLSPTSWDDWYLKVRVGSTTPPKLAAWRTSIAPQRPWPSAPAGWESKEYERQWRGTLGLWLPPLHPDWGVGTHCPACASLAPPMGPTHSVCRESVPGGEPRAFPAPSRSPQPRGFQLPSSPKQADQSPCVPTPDGEQSACRLSLQGGHLSCPCRARPARGWAGDRGPHSLWTNLTLLGLVRAGGRCI